MWQDSGNDTQTLQANMTDVVFRIQCKRLPVDHAAALASAICMHAPELNTHSQSGVHSIHVAGTQNGWERPKLADQSLLLSKRTRLRIRTAPTTVRALLEQLCGVTLDINGFPLHIVSGESRTLKPAATLFARNAYYSDPGTEHDEQGFIAKVISQCQSMGFVPTKVLCGREQYICTTPVSTTKVAGLTQGTVLTRSVLLADIPAADSITLQEHGIGDGRTIGCGLLIPHKGTSAVN